MSGLLTGRIIGKHTIHFGYPATDAHGKIQAVMFAALDLAWLNATLAATQLPEGATLTIVSSNGAIIARHPEPEQWVGKTLPDAPLIKAMLAQHGEGSILAPGLDGVRRLYGFAALSDTQAKNYYVAVGIPEEEAFGAADRSLARSMLLMTVIGLVVAGLAWFGSNWLVLRRANARTGLPHTAEEFGQLAGAFDTMADAVQKNQMEVEHTNKELVRVNRGLKTLSAGNHAMLRATDEQGLLDSMCRAIVDAGGYHMALVFYRDDNESRSLRPMAETGYPGGLAALRTLKMTWAEDEYGRGAAATAIRTGQTSVVRNMLTDPNYAPWWPHLHGSASGVACPLRVNGEVIGAISLYAAEPDAFDAEEMKLLSESADDLAFGIATLRARAEQQKTQEALHRLTHHDALTGLPNETHFTESLIAAIGAGERLNQSFALLQTNIERLREINDALGFSHGDQLLREFGARLSTAAPETAVVARLRGDEFAVLLPDSNANAAIKTVRRLEEVLAQPFLIADIPLDVSSKIGVALFPGHGSTPHDLFRHMDIALQQARKKGVGHAFFNPAQNHGQAHRLTMAGELRRAIEGGDLLLYLQPKVEIATGRVCGAEGLVRWRHAERGLIPPVEFIGLAEHTGLIKPLTEWVIEAALRLNHAWQREGCALPIAVNLSARNLREEELLEKIRRMQTTWGAGAGLLELEVTESAVMDDAEFALGVLRRLRDAGIPLYIDDFGTGYSSLSYLQKLPVEYIKIDQSFVRDMLTSKDSALIVRSTIDLVHDLGRKVVAEGVENREMWDRLAAFGCDIAQGYFLAKPMPAEEFPDWVSRFQPPAPPPASRE